MPPEPNAGKHGACARCPAAIDLHSTYVIGFHKPLKRMEWIYLCPKCEGELLVFLDRKEGLSAHRDQGCS